MENQEIYERTISGEDIEKAVCLYARMSAPSAGSELTWHIGDRLEVLGVTIRQKGWNPLPRDNPGRMKSDEGSE